MEVTPYGPDTVDTTGPGLHFKKQTLTATWGRDGGEGNIASLAKIHTMSQKHSTLATKAGSRPPPQRLSTPRGPHWSEPSAPLPVHIRISPTCVLRMEKRLKQSKWLLTPVAPREVRVPAGLTSSVDIHGRCTSY